MIDGVDDIALAAPHRERPRIDGSIFGVDEADAQRDHGEIEAVRVVTREGLTPNLGARVGAVGTCGHVMAYPHPVRRHVVVAALDERTVRLFTLPAGDGRAGTGEHHALATGEPGRFEHVAGAYDVGVAKLFPRKAVAGPRCEVDDSVPPFECRSDRVEIREIRTHRGDAGHVAPVQGGEARARFETLAHGRTDKAAHAGNQNVLAHGSSSPPKPVLVAIASAALVCGAGRARTLPGR